MPFDSTTFVEESQVVKDLRAAKALIDTPEKWCKGAIKRGDSYCALGAILYGVKHKNRERAETALRGALDRKWGWLVAPFNNDPETTHTDVLDLFDRAIAAETKP